MENIDDDYGTNIISHLSMPQHFEPVVDIKVPQLKVKSLQSARPVSASVSKFLPKFEKIEKELATVVSIAPSNNKKWKDLKDTVNVVKEVNTIGENSTDINVLRSKSDVLEEDGSLYMFWFDAFEKSSSIFLFGKVN